MIKQESELNKGDPSKVKKIEGPTIMTPKGFETPVSMSIGEEENIFAALRAKGWSEEAIAAFRAGKPIMRKAMTLPDGRELILGEDWKDKKADEGH
jgi:hypothetical protein